MKFSHTKLEQIRHNPGNIKQIISSGRGSFSKNSAWKFSIKKYHQKDSDKSFAFRHFEEMFDRNFVANNGNRLIKLELMEKLENYIEDYEKQKFEFYDYSNRISIDIEHGNMISGEIFRFDKTLNGFAITLFHNDDSIWIKELRYPLLQIYFSNKFQCPAELIKVGVYNFIDEVHEYNTFDEITLQQSWEEITKLSDTINKINF
ncbi:MAG: hypothetical protein JZU53_15415 [Paludibacter sp.]|nr:hypothetical protein [Paludibacter sp.]